MTNRQGAGAKRRRSTSSCRRLVVSVPRELVEAVEEEVRAQRAPSASAFISDALEEKIERDRLQEALEEAWREEPVTARERAWADKILRG